MSVFAQITAVSYGLAAAAYLFVAGLLILSRTQHRYKLLLLGASAATAVWAAAAVAGAVAAPFLSLTLNAVMIPVMAGLEMARSIGWIAALAFVLFFAYARRVDRNVAVAVLAATAAAGLFVIGVAITVAAGHALASDVLRLTFMARVLIAVVGLAAAENLFRNSGPEARWAVKYLCFALGMVFAYDFFIYADAALVDQVDPRFYAARGVVDALAAPLVIMAAARSRKWPIDIYVSRNIVVHTATLFAAGAYLMIMAMAGYSLRAFASPWASVAQASVLSAGVVALAAVLASGKVQARLRDFISRNFFSYKYDYRKEWLHFIGSISDSLTELSVPERVIRALAHMTESAAGALWVLREEDKAFQAAGSWNMSDILPTVDVRDPFIAATLARAGIIDVKARKIDGAAGADMDIPAWLAGHARAWLVVPLVHAGQVLGFVVLGESRAARKLNWEDFELLKTAGRQAASYIAEANAARSLAQARRFEEFNRQFAFVAHDIKNLAGQMTLILKNAERHGDNPEFQKDMLKTIGHSVTRMRTMLSQLRAGQATNAKAAPVDISALLRRHADAWKMQIPNLDVGVPPESVTVFGNDERLDAVCNHLLQNALDAAGEKGRVGIELHIEGMVRAAAGLNAANDESWGVITISDNGPGMDPAFVDQKLFQPLNSAKPSGFGIGAFQARQFIREMGGRLDVDTCLGKGTRMIVRLPLARALAAVKDAPDPAMPRESAPALQGNASPARVESGSRELLVSYG